MYPGNLCQSGDIAALRRHTAAAVASAPRLATPTPVRNAVKGELTYATELAHLIIASIVLVVEHRRELLVFRHLRMRQTVIAESWAHAQLAAGTLGVCTTHCSHFKLWGSPVRRHKSVKGSL